MQKRTVSAVVSVALASLSFGNVAYGAPNMPSSYKDSPASEYFVGVNESVPQLTSAQFLEAHEAIKDSQKDTEIANLAKSIGSLKKGESIRVDSGHAPFSIVRTSNGYSIEGIYRDRSICGCSIAVVLYGIGGAALLALAAVLGPGESVVLAGVEMTAEQLGYAGAASGSISALASWADSKFCE